MAQREGSTPGECRRVRPRGPSHPCRRRSGWRLRRRSGLRHDPQPPDRPARPSGPLRPPPHPPPARTPALERVLHPVVPRGAPAPELLTCPARPARTGPRPVDMSKACWPLLLGSRGPRFKSCRPDSRESQPFERFTGSAEPRRDPPGSSGVSRRTEAVPGCPVRPPSCGGSVQAVSPEPAAAPVPSAFLMPPVMSSRTESFGAFALTSKPERMTTSMLLMLGDGNASDST